MTPPDLHERRVRAPLSSLRLTSLDALAGALATLGARRVLLITGGSGRFVERVAAHLGDLPFEVFTGARRHVPEAVLQEASDMLAACGADTLVALGGGAAIGLGKALRLTHDVAFVAIPTTYSGSELTDLFGITAEATKKTGRDPRVRPDVVVHEVALTLDTPLPLTVTSLMNALAHPIATLAAGLLGEAKQAEALQAIGLLVDALEALVQAPDNRRARALALEGAALAAGTLEVGTPGVHHALAHRLGGRFDLEHGALHAVLLPHTLHRLRMSAPEVVAAIEHKTRLPDVEAFLFDLLVRAGAATSLKAMKVSLEELDAFVAAFSDVPHDIVRAAYHGRRPSREVRREGFGLAEPVSVRGDIAKARRVVVALHGRGATADGIVRRVLEIVGDDPDVAIVAPQGTDNQWYGPRFTSPRAELGAGLEAAVAGVERVLTRVLSEVPPERIVLFGFSQGACLLLEVFARAPRPFAALIALSGGAVGGDDELVGPPSHTATRILLGASAGDSAMTMARLDATAALFAGFDLQVDKVPGTAHTLHPRHRLLARPLLSGVAPPPPLTGFGNTFESEALPGALPRDRNTPRLAPLGLVPEQLNVSAFTAPRAHNRRAWLYRVRPAARHGALAPVAHDTLQSGFSGRPEVNLTAFHALPDPSMPSDFIAGLRTLGGAGSPASRRGYALHLYAADRNMEDHAFHDADGDLLILPHEGALTLFTEFGVFDVAPGEVAVIPRGVRFSVQLQAPGVARGWVAEAFGAGFVLPERGPVGANGLADARHFRAPHAWHEDRLAVGHRMSVKLGGLLYQATQDTSPFDVVAWHGNAAPFVYDLMRFSPIGNARFDHIDPSAHAVLSAPLDADGASALDLIAFVPRWDPTEGTFKPPYFHRNATTELNGIIRENAAPGSAFVAGTTYLTPSLLPHGVSSSSVERAWSLADEVADKPSRGSDRSLWFQLESCLPFHLSRWAEEAPNRIHDWAHVFGAYRSHFRTTP